MWHKDAREIDLYSKYNYYFYWDYVAFDLEIEELIRLNIPLSTGIDSKRYPETKRAIIHFLNKGIFIEIKSWDLLRFYYYLEDGYYE